MIVFIDFQSKSLSNYLGVEYCMKSWSECATIHKEIDIIIALSLSITTDHI